MSGRPPHATDSAPQEIEPAFGQEPQNVAVQPAAASRDPKPLVLDTLTTRFLMLFVIVLTIPLLSLIIFTVNLLQSHVEQTTFREALQNDNALQTALARSVRDLPAGQPATRALSDSFLAGLRRDDPTLSASFWALAEPLDPRHARWLGQNDAPTLALTPAEKQAFLETLPSTPTPHAPIVMLPDGLRARMIQHFWYDPRDNRPVARLLTLLPTENFDNALTSYYLGMYGIIVFGLLFSILVAILAARRITQPVLSLVAQVTTLNRVSDLDRRIAVRGVHEINTLAQAFNRLLERLRSEHQMKDEFVATLTHDLKVPLLAEKQTLHYLLQGAYGALNEEQADVLQTLAAASEANLRLVTSILEIYRYDSSQARLRCERLSLATLAQAVMAELLPLAQTRQISLTLRVGASGVEDPEDKRFDVWGDQHELRRALTNLIGNAIAHTPRHGWITCEIEDAETLGPALGSNPSYRDATLEDALATRNRTLARVRDGGAGFSPDDLRHLFTPFMSGGRGRGPISAGLGLYNCYQIARAHGGALWVETTEGEGSCVNLLLPRRHLETSVACEERRCP